GFLPVSGIGAPLRAAKVNGFRLDPKRHLIYAAVDSDVKDFDEADLVILRTCDCPELDTSITLQSGGAGASPDRPSDDGTNATIYITPEMLANGQFRALFDINAYGGGDVHYAISELPISGADADRLLDLSHGATGTLLGGSHQILLNLRPAGADP